MFAQYLRWGTHVGFSSRGSLGDWFYKKMIFLTLCPSIIMKNYLKSWASQSPTDPIANTQTIKLLRLVRNYKHVHYRGPVLLIGSLPRASTDPISYVILWPWQWACDLFSGHVIYSQGHSERLNPGLMKAYFSLGSPMHMSHAPLPQPPT